jgi:hypothetical protein
MSERRIPKGSPEWWFHYALARIMDRGKGGVISLGDVEREVEAMTSNPAKRLFFLLVGPNFTIKEE